MYHIGIIGGGFCGTMTAVQLIRKCVSPIKISLISDPETLHRGTAYNPYSTSHLLNVVTSHMSAFPERPNHFLDWVMNQPEYAGEDRNIIANAFMPRALYGLYLNQIWQAAKLHALDKGLELEFVEEHAASITPGPSSIQVFTHSGNQLICNDVVIATGNQLPRNHKIRENRFYESSPNYFRNPWEEASVHHPPEHLPVLLIGNGLSMVDTVIGLLENGYRDKIISISPNGFNLLPHRHGGISYGKLLEEVIPGMSLLEWLTLVNKHRKRVRKLGVSAEPIIDSLRERSQDIWRGFTEREKEIFLTRLKSLWGVARHRVPLQIHDMLQQLRLEHKLQTYTGNIINMTDGGNFVRVEWLNKKTGSIQKVDVARVINCSGPESDIEKMDDCLLKDCYERGYLKQDRFKLGIEVEWPSMQVFDSANNPHSNLFAIGSNLRGVLWETTSVKELREQAANLAETLKWKANVASR
jgi:uncharacterized NAD(P)/FAD-binding protein YdhS